MDVNECLEEINVPVLIYECALYSTMILRIRGTEHVAHVSRKNRSLKISLDLTTAVNM